MYKMLVVDDEYLVRMGIRETIDWETYHIEIIGEADNGKTGLKLAQELLPDIIISDIKMPVMDGMAFVKRLTELELDCTVVILSGYKDFDYAKGTLESGAYSYLLKPIDNEELITTVVEALKKLEYKRASKAYYHQLEEQIPTLRDRVIDDLITGNYMDTDEIKAKCNVYNLKEIKQGVVIYGQVDHQDENIYTEEQIENAIHALFKYLVENLNDENIYYIERLYEEHFVILLNHQIEMNTIENLCQKAVATYEIDFSEIVSIGISQNYQRLEQTNASYNQAKEAANNRLFPMLNRIVRFDLDREKYKPLVVEAMELIAKNYHHNLTIKSVAEQLFISESYLMHMFKDNVGKTFNEVLTEYRILIAKKMLKAQKYKIYEIAEMVGYNDVKYFSQVFRKRVGSSPSQYINDQES